MRFSDINGGKNKRNVRGRGGMCHLVKIIARAVEKRYHIYLLHGPRLAGGHRNSRLKPIIYPPPFFYTRVRTVLFFSFKFFFIIIIFFLDNAIYVPVMSKNNIDFKRQGRAE
jgi:hypothetical protein